MGPSPNVGPPNGLPAPAAAAIAEVQQQISEQAGQSLVLHHVTGETHPDGFTTHLYVALPPGVSSWMPGQGPIPWMAQAIQNPITGDWVTQVMPPSDMHSFLVKLPDAGASEAG